MPGIIIVLERHSLPAQPGALFVVPLLRMAAVGEDVFTGDTALAREARKRLTIPNSLKF